MSSRNPAYEGPEDATVEFVLGNGQADEYLARWAVSRDDALRAVEYLFTQGQLAPWIQWHDDAIEE